MTSLTELEREKNHALKKCQAAKEKMKTVADNPLILAHVAQEANDAWLEFKHKEVEYNNQLVMKQRGELYGC